MSGVASQLPRCEEQPDGSIKVLLASPILYHTEPKREFTLRQPTIREVWDIGDPVTWVFSDAGAIVSTVDRPTISRWINLLIDGHDPDLIGDRSDVALALLIEDAVIGFFRNARKRLKSPSAL